MALTPFSDGMTLDWCAAIEQATLHWLIYFQGTQAVLDSLNQTGNPAAAVVRNDVEPDFAANFKATPVFLLFEHSGQYWLVVKGTYTSLQWIKNVTGAVTTSSLGNNNGVFHGAFATMAEAVWGIIKPHVQGDEKVLNLYGNSLGGAVAWMVGALVKQDFPARVVNVLTAASPRVMKGAYTGLSPNVRYHLQTRADPVVFLPPNLPLVPPPFWDQQGTKFVISVEGAVLPSDTNSGEIVVANLSTTAFQNHWTETYVRALQGRVSAFDPPCQTATDLLVSAGLADDAGRPIPGPVFTLPVAQTPKGGAMAVFKVSMFFGYKKWGWVESHYWSLASGDLAKVEVDATKLGFLRRKFLHGSCTLEGIRISAADATGKTFLATGEEMIYEGPGVGAGAAADDKNALPSCSPPWRAAYVRVYSAGALYAGNHYFRGVTDDVTCTDLAQWTINLGQNSSPERVAMDDYLTFLCNGNSPLTAQAARDLTAVQGGGKPKGGGKPPKPAPAQAVTAAGGWSFQVSNKDTGRSQTYFIDGLLIDTNRFLWIKPGKLVADNKKAITLAINDRIHLHGLTGPGLTGTSGDTRVREIGAGEFLNHFRVSKKQPIDCDFEYLGGAVLWRLADTLVPYDFGRYGRIVKKSTGAAYFGTDGAGKKRCDRYGNRVA